MSAHATAAIVVVLAWWASTGAVLRVVWWPRATHRAAFVAATVLAAVCFVGLWTTRDVASVSGAYVAFACALGVWGWQELGFLFGFITGPRKAPCPPDATGWRRFGLATHAVIHHEVALAATFLAIVALTWGATNQVGTGTFAVLWVMRLSAKFNVYLGVRNLSEEFVPPHLRYLGSYFRRARFNALMPLSVVAGVIVFGVLAARALVPQAALPADAAAFGPVGHSLVATLLGLALLEHVFLMLPIPDAVLWRWALPAEAPDDQSGKPSSANGPPQAPPLGAKVAPDA